MILEARNIHKIYRNGQKEVRAVDGISLELKTGKSLAIIGPSGAGKSTLLHLLGGLDTPTSGSVILDGSDIHKLSDSRRAAVRNRSVGFVFQFYHLLPEFTALENVMLPALISGRGRREDPSTSLGAGGRGTRERAKDLLEKVGLGRRIHHRPGELSGGESQRVAIARALVNNPKVLLCDEPTGNLDSKMAAAVYEILFDLKNSSGLTLVIVSHDERLAERTDHTIRIKDGKIV